MKAVSVAVGALVLGLTAGTAMAEMSAADKTFATKAAAGGAAEVELGRLAAQSASDAKVKEFGQRMVADHTLANQELQQIAKAQSLTLPTRPDAADSATEQKLRNLKGQAFDAAYMRDMLQDHRKDIADFSKEAETGRDPALKAFAQKTLPTLQQHLQMAEAAQPK
jgi:putative membrane protein